MSISKDQARMLTALAIACRPVGASKWDESGTFTNIGRIAHWPIAMVCEHVIAHASDPAAKTPGVIGSSYTPQPQHASLSPRNPKPQEACAHCGNYANACGGRCKDAGDDEPASPALVAPARILSRLERGIGPNKRAANEETT